MKKKEALVSVGVVATVFAVSFVLIGGYSKYFRPQSYRNVTDAELTSFDEIVWRISRTSFEFVPEGVRTTKSELGTTILAITPEQLPREPYQLLEGDVDVRTDRLTARKKEFTIQAREPIVFRLNTYFFPGWKASSRKLGKTFEINDDNDLKLSTVELPEGTYDLRFEFTDTPVRAVSNAVTLVSLSGIGAYAIYSLTQRRKA